MKQQRRIRQDIMTCFPLQIVRRRRCLMVAALLIASINLIYMWKVSYWSQEEFEFNALRLTFTRKQRTLNHTLLAKHRHLHASPEIDHHSKLQAFSSTVLPKRDVKPAGTRPVYRSHTLVRNNIIPTKTDKELSTASIQWLPTQKARMPTPQADHDHSHSDLTRVTLAQDYIELKNITAINKNDSEIPVPGQAFESEQEAVRACELAEQKCKAIYKYLKYFLTLESDFVVSSAENSTLYVKPQFTANLAFSDTEMKCGALPAKITLHNSSREMGCLLPDIDPFDKSSMRYFRSMAPMACEREGTLFTRYHDGFLEVVINHDRGAPLRHLSFQTIYRNKDGSDWGFSLGERTPLKYKRPVLKPNHDFIQVNAEFFNGMTQTDFHAQVIPKPEVLQRTPLQKAGLQLNIIILGLDQTSHATFQRLLTSSYNFLRDELEAFMFKGFSLVGEATTPQLTALLTGRTVEENCKSHEARTGFEGARTVDEWPFIFKDLKQHGYATLFSEDAPPIAAFNMRLKGFNKPPCDHYARPFWSAVPHKLGGGLHEKCINSQPQHKLQLEYLKSMFRAYPVTPKFGFTFLSSLCHHESVMPLGASAEDFHEFFKSIRDLGFLNDTMLVVMGDHGARTGEFRSTMQGKLEERLPILSIALPASFRLKYPELVNHLELNTEVIISPLDLHATFMHMLKYPTDPSHSDLTRGKSLFSEIPRSRTCHDAKIPEYFCPCVQWLPLSIMHAHVRISVLRAAHHINSLLEEDPTVSRLCVRLTVDAILGAWQETPGAKLHTFNGIQDGDGLGFGRAEFKNATGSSGCSYQVKFRTKPGYGIFEASVKLIDGRFFVSEHISRINLYGAQPDCIKNSHPYLRKFCYCRHDY